MQKKFYRREDRRSAHNASLVLGLALLAGETTIEYAAFVIENMYEPVRGQAAN